MRATRTGGRGRLSHAGMSLVQKTSQCSSRHEDCDGEGDVVTQPCCLHQYGDKSSNPATTLVSKQNSGRRSPARANTHGKEL